jgi:3-phosphoshikimate 1-carboxyvinyltransferase
MDTVFSRRDSAVVVSPSGPVQAKVRVPGSKSLTNRYFLIAALAEGTSSLRYALSSDDTHFMAKALRQLGVEVQMTEDASGLAASVEGRTDWASPEEALFIGNAGTAMRFLTPAIAVRQVVATIGGNARMAVRPIADLVDGLRSLGAQVDYTENDGCPPLHIQRGPKPGQLKLPGKASSQYLSGMLMALPCLDGPSEIEIIDDLVSKTYVEMTLDCMRRFGVDVAVDAAFRRFKIEPATYRAQVVEIEPDASTASYWVGLPLMVGGSVTIRNVPESSHQGDFGLIQLVERMGAVVTRERGDVTIAMPADDQLQGIDVDMNTMSDVAPTLAVIATRAQSETIIRNVGNMRIKECDRIDTLQKAFDALGLKMETGADWLRIFPSRVSQAATVDPEEDHRMAMVYALLGLADGGVTIRDADCVAKTYPDFYDAFAEVCAPRTLTEK